MPSAIYPPTFKGGQPGLVPRVASQAGKLLSDDGTWVTQARNYLGEIAGASVPGAGTVNAGDFYYINATGGAFTEGKWALSNGTAWTELDSIDGILPQATQTNMDDGVADKYADPEVIHGYVNPRFATRQGSPQVISDGATTDRAIVQTGSTRTALAGAPVATWVGFVTIPSSAPSENAFICFVGPIQGSITTTTSNQLELFVSVSGNLALRVNGASGGVNTNYQSTSYTNIVGSTYGGQRVFLELYLVGGGNTFSCRINGTDITSGFGSWTQDGSYPNLLDGSLLTSTYFLTGYNWPAGPAPIGGWINAALSADDRTYWLTTGQPPAWVARGGSQAAFYSSDFSSSLDSWAQNVTSTATRSYGITKDGETNCLEFAYTSTGATVFARVTTIDAIGRYYYFRGKVYQDSGSTVYAGIGDNSGQQMIGALQAVPSGVWTDVAVFGYATSVSLRFGLYTDSGGATSASFVSGKGVWFKGITTIYAGALSLPAVGPDRVIRDATRIAPANDAYLVGMSPTTLEGDGWIRARRTTSGYLMADRQLIGDGRGVVAIQAIGDGTFSLGDSAGSPSTVLSSVTGTANAIPFTPLKALTNSGKLYLTLGTATDVTVWVRTGPITSLT